MKQQPKTTKHLLEDALKDQKRTPLYDTRAIEELRQTFNRWQQACVQPADRENWQTTPRLVLGSQTPRDLLYTPLSNPDFDYAA